MHGAVVLDSHYRRLPLAQGGPKINIQVIVKMEHSPRNKDALFKYESLDEQYYKDPVDSKFSYVTDTVLKDLADEETDDGIEDAEQAADSHCHDEAGAEEDMEQAANTQ